MELISIPAVPWATGHMVGAHEEALETQRLHHLYKHVSNPAELQAMSSSQQDAVGGWGGGSGPCPQGPCEGLERGKEGKNRH